MKIMVINDHPVLRGGIAALFKHAVAGALVEQSGSLEEALHLVERHHDIDRAA